MKHDIGEYKYRESPRATARVHVRSHVSTRIHAHQIVTYTTVQVTKQRKSLNA